MKYLFVFILLTITNYINAQKLSTLGFDQRVELISIVFRLSGAEEYTLVNYPEHTFKKYVDSVESYFRKYEQHPAVQYAKKLKKRGIGYNYVMYLPLIVTQPPNMKISIPLVEGKENYRWDSSTALEFTDLLNQFYNDTDFQKFVSGNQSLYQEVSTRYLQMVSNINTNWFERFYGYKSKIEFTAINALSIGPYNYNVDVEDDQGEKTSFAILGSSATDSLGMPVYNQRYLNVLIHEFNHSFANPVINKNEEEFRNVGKTIFKDFKKNNISTNVAYANWQSVLCEYLVRAAVIKYLKDNDYDKTVISNQIEQEYKSGFPWVKELSERLDFYSENRERFKNMTEFIPELVSFFEARQLTGG